MVPRVTYADDPSGTPPRTHIDASKQTETNKHKNTKKKSIDEYRKVYRAFHVSCSRRAGEAKARRGSVHNIYGRNISTAALVKSFLLSQCEQQPFSLSLGPPCEPFITILSTFHQLSTLAFLLLTKLHLPHGSPEAFHSLS